jgi:DNA repair photolyase
MAEIMSKSDPHSSLPMTFPTIKRAFASFGGVCQFGCLHCYTFHEKFIPPPQNTIREIVASLSAAEFDIAYISGHRESFIDPSAGLDLMESIFSEYKCDILFTTRNVFSEAALNRLKDLNSRMRESGHLIIGCVSIPALHSIKKIEPSPLIPSPKRRIEFLFQLRDCGLPTVLTLRPLFPDRYVPLSEPLSIIDAAAEASTVVLSSGVVLEASVKSRLQGLPTDIHTVKAPLMPCLNNNYDALYVDVEAELIVLRSKCIDRDLPFFTESTPAVQYLRNDTRCPHN